MTGRRRALAPSLVILALSIVGRGGAGGQDAPHPGMLPDSRGATMDHKVERTILKVDVLTLTVRVDETTANRLAGVVDTQDRYHRNHEETVAGIVVDAAEGVAQIRFLRSITLAQFLEGVDEDMGNARDAGWIDGPTFSEITTGLRDWFSFLSTRGIKKGDLLTYHVVGDSLRTTYQQVGESGVAFDQTDVGRNNVMALWGGYYAPGSTFRQGLTRSLWSKR